MVHAIVPRMPTREEFIRLYEAVGWEKFLNPSALAVALARSYYGCVCLCDGKAVGMGRIVGDHGLFFYIQDIAVDPDHQRRGIGTGIMENLVGYLKANAPPKAYIGLFSSQQGTAFYKKFGFETATEVAPGMYRYLP